MKRNPILSAVLLITAFLINFAAPKSGYAQISPGPHEMLPYEDGYIVEAFKDLLTNAPGIADWSGWSGTTWVSPDAYDDHLGTDVSVQTGTKLFATCAGTVVEAVGTFARDDHTTYYGNFVHIALDTAAPMAM